MSIKFTYHSIERAGMRGITIDNIRLVINSPDNVRESDDAYINTKMVSGRLITVIYRKIKNINIIITTY